MPSMQALAFQNNSKHGWPDLAWLRSLKCCFFGKNHWTKVVGILKDLQSDPFGVSN